MCALRWVLVSSFLLFRHASRPACTVCGVACDIYMHNPRGSNNKLNEVSNNARNQNRLFDSQNNARGGYQVGDDCKPVCSNANGQYDKDAEGAGKGQMRYYEDSLLTVEWTNQHGCGNAQKNVLCNLVLQARSHEDMMSWAANSGVRRRSMASNSAWVPVSTTLPASSTTILSALQIVESRCATTTVVHCFCSKS